MTKSLTELLKQYSEKLCVTSQSPRLDAELLVSHVTGLSRSQLISRANKEITIDESERLNHLMQRRLKGEPIAYILGFQEFWSMPLKVSPHTLIPRPETEHLVEKALSLLTGERTNQILDLGTGSGAIALALGKELPKSKILAVDISEQSLMIAQDNAIALNINNVNFVVSNWFENLVVTEYDMIVSNPPYIREGDPHLSGDGIEFEPEIALTSGKDGLNAIRHIIEKAPAYLKHNGWLLLEHGWDQASSIQQLLSWQKFSDIETVFDYAGKARVTFARYNKSNDSN